MKRETLMSIIALSMISTFIAMIMMILLMDLGKIEGEISAFLIGMWERDVRMICSYYFYKETNHD